MNFNIFNIFIIAGVIQGFIFTLVVLFNKKYRAKTTLFLVSLICIYSLGNLTYILPDIGVMSLTKMYNTLFLPFASLIPVLIYFYVVFFLFPNKDFNFKDKILFLPFAILLVLTLFFRIDYFLGDKSDILNPLFVRSIHINETFSVLYSIVLLTISLKKIHNVQRQQKVFNRNIIRSDLKWLFFSIATILFFTFYWAYLTFINIYTTQSEPVSFYVLWIAVAALIYWLGHIGIYKYGIIKDRKNIRQFQEKNNLYNYNDTAFNNNASLQTTEHIVALENLFTHDKIYLDSSLSLESMAKRLNLSPSYLSRIIHAELNMSFPDYLNSFRIEEAKNYLRNPEFSNYTIVAIGLEAGFNSKSSFYDVFKRTTGQTPSAFQKQHTRL